MTVCSQFRFAGALFILLFLSACGDPIETKFVGNCVNGGNSDERCACTYEILSQEVGDIDEEFVDFASDFAKWTVEQGEEPLEKEDFMVKYDLSEEDFHDLSGAVGNAMLRAFSSCS